MADDQRSFLAVLVRAILVYGTWVFGSVALLLGLPLLTGHLFNAADVGFILACLIVCGGDFWAMSGTGKLAAKGAKNYAEAHDALFTESLDVESLPTSISLFGLQKSGRLKNSVTVECCGESGLAFQFSGDEELKDVILFPRLTIQWPEFVLQPKGMFHDFWIRVGKLLGVSTKKSWRNYATVYSSKTYVIGGPDKQAIEGFLTDERKAFFEDTPGLRVECGEQTLAAWFDPRFGDHLRTEWRKSFKPADELTQKSFAELVYVAEQILAG